MWQELKRVLEKREPFALATVVGGDRQELLGKKLLYTGNGVTGELLATPWGGRVREEAQAALAEATLRLAEIAGDAGRLHVLVECYQPVARLLVLGGGHIALPLVRIAALLNFEIVVIDDRPDFASRARFPEAGEVICSDYVPALRRQRIDAGTSVVIVTRGHRHDLDCLEYVLGREPGYVGMIGSRRRIRLVRQHLLEAGYPPERLDRVYMPIGLKIGAETPEEIAVSIAAQLVAARRRVAPYPLPPTSTRQEWELLEQLLKYVEAGQPLVAATVLRTKGSTPRKAGAKMLVLPDGSSHGTVGGGCGEAEVRNEALSLFDHPGAKIHRVVLQADVAADEGMACGGEMEVFLERLDR